METTNTKRRTMTQEQLEKLKAAREKANQVRMEKAAKLREIKELEKTKKEQEIEAKLSSLKGNINQTMPESTNVTSTHSEVVQAPTNKTMLKTKKNSAKAMPKKKLIEQVLEESTDEEDSSDSDNEDEITPVKQYLREKYKAKYKQRYEAKHMGRLVKESAHNHIRNRLDDEIFRLASAQIFGT